MTSLKVGSQGADVKAYQLAMNKRYPSYSREADGQPLKVDSYFGYSDRDVHKQWQVRSKRPVTGVVSDEEFGLIVQGKIPAAPSPLSKVWIYTAPGSGANWDVGPSFEFGNWAKGALGVQHQPLYFQKGGYLGLLGGDSKFSYNEVVYDEYKSLEWCLDHNPNLNDPNLELWFSGYSQSADGMEDALEILFGDGGFVIPQTGEVTGPGRLRHLRSKIKGVIQFGNPSKDVTGIARKKRPAWLLALIRNVTTKGDFYAEVPVTDKIRPAFYAAIVKAEMELPFFVYVLNIAIPIIMEWAATLLPIFKPLLGNTFGPLVQMALGTIQGLQGLGGSALFGGLLGQAGGIDASDPVPGEMLAILSPTGILQNIPGLIALVGALPGLQAHGEYHLPKPEFQGRTGIQVACDIFRSFYGR